ncbi:hypothetical protein D1872_270440 [compost metagenome]
MICGEKQLLQLPELAAVQTRVIDRVIDGPCLPVIGNPMEGMRFKQTAAFRNEGMLQILEPVGAGKRVQKPVHMLPDGHLLLQGLMLRPDFRMGLPVLLQHPHITPEK